MIAFTKPLESRVVRAALILITILFSIGVSWGVHYHVTSAQSGSYSMDLVFDYNWDGWQCSGSFGNCNFLCNAASAGRGCYVDTCLGGYEENPPGNLGNINHKEYVCNYYPPACTGDSSCAANTCSDSTCSDSCGNVYNGTMNCVVCDAAMGSACNVNACGVGGGTVQCNGSCSGAVVGTNAGSACTSQPNTCGDTSSGTLQCDGSCSASPPAVVDVCPSDPGIQCSVSECSLACVWNAGSACISSANACGDTSTGIVPCWGGCTASLPAVFDACPSTPGEQCNVSECSSLCAWNEGVACNVNACGVAGGTIQCDGSCSGSTPATVDACPLDAGTQCNISECSPVCDPNEGASCTRTNSCSLSNTGSIQCDGSCSVSAPSDLNCPARLQPPPLTISSDRIYVGRGDMVQISWNAGTNSAFDCSVFGPNFGPFDFVPSIDGSTGSEPSAPINAKSQFTILCVDPPYGTRYMSSTIVETTGTMEEL